MQTVVLGAGLAGLGAATELQAAGQPFTVLERDSAVGGMARTDELDGFLFDRGAHFLHTRSAVFREALHRTNVPLAALARRSAVLIGGTIVPYPIQFNLWALPPLLRQAARREIQTGWIEERPEPANFAGALGTTWGETLVELFFRPYNEKLWQRPLEELPPDCAGRFLPNLDPALIERGSREPVTMAGYNARMFYPVSGRIDDLWTAMADQLALNVRCGTPAVRIDLDERVCVAEDSEWPFDALVSSLPLPDLLALCGLRVPPGVDFAHAEVLNLRVGFVGEVLTDLHWLYVPDPAVPFYRVTFPSNINPGVCPPGSASVSLEYGVRGADALGATRESLAAAAIAHLTALNLVRCTDITITAAFTLTPGYVVYRRTGRAAFDVIHELLHDQDIFSVGRYGEWEYLSMEDAFLSGLQGARQSLRASGTDWSLDAAWPA